MKAIIPVIANEDEVVDGVVVFTLSPETQCIIYLCLDTALFLTWLWVMYALISRHVFPLLGLPILLLRSIWFFPAQNVWKELGLEEGRKPRHRKKRNRRQ